MDEKVNHPQMANGHFTQHPSWDITWPMQDVPRPASAPGSAGPTATLGSGPGTMYIRLYQKTGLYNYIYIYI